MTASNNAQFVITVNKDTVLGNSLLKSVNYNGNSEAGTGISLSSFLYKENVI